jgi:hypothetical protein
MSRGVCGEDIALGRAVWDHREVPQPRSDRPWPRIGSPVTSPQNPRRRTRNHPPFEVWGIWLPADDANGGRWIGPGIGQDGGRVFFTSREAAEAQVDEFEGSVGPVGATIVKLKVERA